MPTRPRHVLPAALLLASLLCACGGGSEPSDSDTPLALPTTTYFPPLSGSAWETISPARLGWDTVALEAALAWAGSQESSAVLILWRGRIVAERYWDGWTSTTAGPWYSAGKTVTGALVGQLADEGRLSLDAPVADVLGAGWSRAPRMEEFITIRHLLAMASGLNDSLQQVFEPGFRFYYNNPAYYQLFDVLETAAGLSFQALEDDRLWSRIGASTVQAVPSTDTGEPGYIHWGSARDFARFGLLVLAAGRWNGTVVLSDSAFLTASRRPSGSDNLSYGYLWWLNGGTSYRTPGPDALPTFTGPLFPSAPLDLAAGLGKDDKKLYVVPSLELVLVRLGPRAPVSGATSAAAISTFDDAFWARLRPALGL